MNHGAVLFSLVAALLAAGSAAAQPAPAAAHKNSIAAGATWAFASPGDRDGAPGITIAARRWFTPAVGLEADFGWWRTRRTSVFDLPGQPGGVLPIHEVTTRTDKFYSFGVRAVVGKRVNRTTFVLGGGPALFVTTARTRIETTTGDQTDVYIALGFRRHKAGVHAIGAVELLATERVTVFGGLRGEIRGRDGDDLVKVIYPAIGVRVAF